MHRLWFDMMMLGVEAQQAFWLRTMKLARGGKRGQREARRMVTEKMVAAGEAGLKLSRGGSPGSVVAGYRTRVRANIRRLR